MTLDSTYQIPDVSLSELWQPDIPPNVDVFWEDKNQYGMRGTWLGKTFWTNLSTDTVQQAANIFITRGKYSCHLGENFLVYVERPQVNVYVIYHCYPFYCEPRCFYFECLCSFGQLQCFWGLDVLVHWKYHEVWRSDNCAVIGIVLLLTKGIYVGIVLKSPWGKKKAWESLDITDHSLVLLEPRCLSGQPTLGYQKTFGFAQTCFHIKTLGLLFKLRGHM